MKDRLIGVMIVDDEDIFCTHLAGLIDWKLHGFQICAQARNGEEAKQLLQSHNPDIVITDIKMPKVDGVSLITYISKKYEHIQTIALSGYDEYESVRGSLKYGALDYLLKHQVNSANLLATLNLAKKRINDNHTRSIADSAATERAEIGLLEQRRSVLREVLLSGDVISKQDLIDRTRRVGLDLNRGHFAIMVVEITQMSMHMSKYSGIEWMSVFEQITSMIERLISDANSSVEQVSLLLPEPDNRFTILFSMPKGYSYLLFNNFVVTHVQGIRAALKRNFNFTANYSISNHISDFTKIPEKYRQTLGTLTSSFHQGHDMVFREEKGCFNPPETNKTGLEIYDESHIYSLLRDGQTDQLLAYVEELFDRKRAAGTTPERLQMMFAELLSVLSRYARQEHIDSNELFSDIGIYSRIRYMTIDEMKNFFLDAYKRFTELRASHQSGSSSEITQRACKYIRQNYKEPISLIDVADYVSVSPSYLSRIFKADTDKTVVEYINKVRIKAAIQMIDGGVPVKGLAEKLGFNSRNYFITVFRQATGKTPTQYRKNESTSN